MQNKLAITVRDRFERRIDRLFDQIDEAVDELDWAFVRDRAQTVLTLDPDNGDALRFLASSDRALGGLTQAAAIHALSPPPVVLAPELAPELASVQPVSFASGRYQVKQFLGEGGKKKVYLAHDTLLDREVAFALIKTAGLDDTSGARIQREAQAMGRLGSHPNIVTVFDLGQEQGRPYMVTELMGGGDVEQVIKDAQGHGLPLSQVVKIARETCQGMDFAHSRGIVHRDLKPGNVWLTKEGAAKIGDFGLAVALDRSRLTTEGMMVGTVSYMPPEQAMGGEVTPRSDLYSLGAMLYEMVTGRPPFLGDDAVAIIGQHINTPPVAPSWHNGQCPRPLEALIMRLLTKDPLGRPASASEVLVALDLIGAEPDIAEQYSIEIRDETHALDSLSGGVFVGRQREMGELKGCLEDALSGRGRLVTLVGEPGIGKSRTARELGTYAGLRGAQVLWGRCHEVQGAPPLWPWVQAIRSYVRDAKADELRLVMAAGAADIAEVVSDVSERLPGLEKPHQLEPEQARFRLFDSITTFLINAAQRKPIVLVLDDLHWADQPSLLLLEHVVREVAGARVMIIGTYWDMERSRQHPLTRTLSELAREPLYQKISLRGLDQQDENRFIELASGVTPPAGMVEVVHRQTDGNPLFVTEVVRLLVQEGELTQDDSTGPGRADAEESWNVRIPECVREVIGRRLDRLPELCSEMLTVSSVIGREFTLEQLSGLFEHTSRDSLLEALENALSAQVIEELPGSVGRYQFTHALIQETLTGELSTTCKVRLHARVAQALEKLYGTGAGAHATELAHHFAEAEAVLGADDLVRYALLAGEKALSSYAYEDALAHFERGLTARNIALSGTETASDEEAANLLFGLARAQSGTVELHQLAEPYSAVIRAFEYYAGAGDVARAVAAAGFPMTLPAFPIPGVAYLFAHALSLVAEDSHEAGRLLSRYGGILGVGADYEGAQEALSRAISIARREGDAALEMQASTYAAVVSYRHLRWQESVNHGLQAIELATEVENPFMEIRSRNRVADGLLHIGNLDAARPHALAARDLAEGVRIPRMHFSNSFVPITYLSTLVGDWQSAREYSDLGLKVSPLNTQLLLLRTLLEQEAGEEEQGQVYLERLIEATRLGGSEQLLALGRASMAITAIARISGAPVTSEAAQSAAESVLSSQPVSPLLAAYAKTGLALLAVEQGDRSAAAEHYAYLLGQEGAMIQTVSSADRLLGGLARTIGDLDHSADHFKAGLAFCRNAGYRPELAWICFDYSEMLRERDGKGDRAKAISLLDESLTISSQLGMRPLMERVLASKLGLQGAGAVDSKTTIDALASAVGNERPDFSPHAAPDGTVTILFSDIEGCTAMTHRLGDLEMQKVLDAHNALIRREVASHGGFEVKSMGDGFMLAFSSARRALQCAMTIQQAFDKQEPTQEPLRVRMGLHTGEAIKDTDDFYGRNVILASRIANKAEGGQILVSALLKELVESAGDLIFMEEREVELKGLPGQYRVYLVDWKNYPLVSRKRELSRRQISGA